MRRTRRITQAAFAAALGALVLFLGHWIQFGEFFWYLIASALLLVCLVQTGYLGGFLCYLATLGIAFLLTGDLFYIIPFAILGLIPFMEHFFGQIHWGKIPRFALGMLFFDLAIVSTFLIFENKIMAFLPEWLESLYPTGNHWVLYLGYAAEAFVIGFPSYLAYSFGLARATFKLRLLLKVEAHQLEKSRTREEKRLHKRESHKDKKAMRKSQ